jgi:hypothetical protein
MGQPLLGLTAGVTVAWSQHNVDLNSVPGQISPVFAEIHVNVAWLLPVGRVPLCQAVECWLLAHHMPHTKLFQHAAG